jgi:hypothetical protein
MTPTSQERPSLRAIFVDQMPTVRRALNSVQDFDTQVLTLAPPFIEALRQAAPRRRANHVRQAMVAALVMIVGIFAVEPSIRAFALDTARSAIAVVTPKKALPVAPAGGVPAIDAAVVTVPVAETTAALEIPPIVVVSTSPSSAPAAKAPAKKARAGGGKSHGGRG